MSTTTTTTYGVKPDIPEKSLLSQHERLPNEKKKPEVKAKPKLPKVIPVVKKVRRSVKIQKYKYS